MNYRTIVCLSSLLLLGLTQLSSANDFGAKVMMERIETWQGNLLKQKVINEKCVNQLTKWYDLLKAGPVMTDNWAWRMLDAWDKLNPGILTGNIFGLGQMDECLSIDELHEGTVIKGQYCFSGLIIPIAEASNPKSRNSIATFADNINGNLNRAEATSPIGISLSICIPHECNWMEILEVEDSELNTCQTKDSEDEWDDGDWAFLIFMIVIGVLVVTSTCYDWYLRCNEKETIHPIALAFSFYTNGEKLLKISNNPEQFQSLNGIRAISMMWVLVGHRFNASTFSPIVNIEATMKWMQSSESLYIIGAPVAVDSFLFLTGVVMAYGFMKTQCKPKARFNIVLFYIHRYLRLTPAVGVLYFFYVSLYRHISSGPLWPMAIKKDRQTCLDNSLGYFLYIQNFVNPAQVCLGHTWYLSIDMQLFIISPIILIPMVKYRKYAGYGLAALILLSILPPALITYFNDITLQNQDYMKDYYIQPYTRMGPWLVGLLLGFIFYQLRDRNIKINRVVNLCMWTIVLVGMFFILWFAPEMMYTKSVSAFAIYNGFHRLCWALGLMWIIFACQNGCGGFVHWFLTLPIFQVWARISYSMYLLHIIVQLMAVYRKRAPMFFDGYGMINEACGDILSVSALGFFYCMMFESPIVVIEKVLLGPNGYIIRGLDTVCRYVMNKLGLGNKKQIEEKKNDPKDISVEKPYLENEKQDCPV